MPISRKRLLDNAITHARSIEKKTGHSVDIKEVVRHMSDAGITNVRTTGSLHWRPWLGLTNRCVVPFTSFSEFNKEAGGNIWFALSEDRPRSFFAGIWTRWTSIRKVKEGETTNDLFAFLTTEPNAQVREVHPKAMPVILRDADEIEHWMTASTDEALMLQRPLADGELKIVATGTKEDRSAEMLTNI